MSQTSVTFSSYDAAGNREDLANAIYSVSPWETPFIKLIPKVKATATNHEWQTDSLAAAAGNAQIEGDSVGTFDTRAPTTKLGNRTQISYKTVVISGTQEEVNKAGRDSEMRYQQVKMGRELRRDMEKALLDNNAKVTGNDSTARELAGVPAWLATNTLFNGTGGGIAVGTSDGEDPSPADGSAPRADATSQAAFNEEYLYQAHQATWDSGGNPDVIMTGSFNTRKVAGSQGNSTKFTDAASRRVINNVKIVETPFGEMMLVANRFSRGRDLFLLQSDLWALATLRDVFWKPLAATGDHEKGMLIVEYTLEARNEAGNGGVFDLTTS